MARVTETWFEVWAEDQEVPYRLILRPAEGGFEVLNPREGNRRVHFATTYVDATYWLGEDEFELVGRTDFDADG